MRFRHIDRSSCRKTVGGGMVEEQDMKFPENQGLNAEMQTISTVIDALPHHVFNIFLY